MKIKILIIEDDPILSNNIRTLLEEEGFSVFFALNGVDGIVKAEKLLPDLIVCDIMMPGKNGFEVKNELNKNENTFDIPLIFLTAKAEIADLRKGMDLGAEDYLFKPYKAEDLLRTIKMQIQKKRRIVSKIVEKKTSEISQKEKEQRIIINIGNEYKLVKYESLYAIVASSQYCNLVLENGKKYLVRKSLNEWEEKLPSKDFIRIHRSTIINKNVIVKIEKGKNNIKKVYLKNISEPFFISRKYSEYFK